MKHFPIFILILFLVTTNARAQKVPGKKQWVDSVFNSLNNNEKIGQLFMVPLPAAATDNDVKGVVDKVKNNKIGGIILPAKGVGGPVRQVRTSRIFQDGATIPLFIAIETGNQSLGLSLDSITHFPLTAIAGALRSDSLVFEAGRCTGQQMKMLGINFNFTANAVIRNAVDTAFSSAFGDNRINVTRKSARLRAGPPKPGRDYLCKRISVKRHNRYRHTRGHTGNTAYSRHNPDLFLPQTFCGPRAGRNAGYDGDTTALPTQPPG